MTKESALQRQFTEAMLNIYKRALQEAGYHASRFHQMIGEYGGYETAKMLIYAPQPSEGYTALWERQRLDLTVEALILRQEWQDLFTEEDRAAARARLKQYNYDFGV